MNKRKLTVLTMVLALLIAVFVSACSNASDDTTTGDDTSTEDTVSTEDAADGADTTGDADAETDGEDAAADGAETPDSNDTASTDLVSISVSVTHADGTEASFSYTTDEEFLGDALLNEGLIAGDESDYGLYVTEVDGETASWDDDGAYWAFYENGEYATLGVDSTPVTDGGEYSFVYTVE